MKRYSLILTEKDIYEALNKLRDAFLAAKNGSEVDEIMHWLLTPEEKIKLGRRILVAEWIKSNFSVLEICSQLRVGKATVTSVLRQLQKNPEGFMLIEKRGKKVEVEYQKKKYKKTGGSTLVFKKKEYTGIKRKDIVR